MKKVTTVFLLFFAFYMSVAQEAIVVPVVDTTSAWIAKGDASILFNQSTFNNWLPGGENNISGNIGVNYDFNYSKGLYSWDNKVIASYGLVKTKTSSFAKKTDDRFEFNSILGRRMELGSRWYYSAFLNFKTQFTKGYSYERDVNGAETRTAYTNIFSPAYLLVGPGVLWKRDENLKINVSPATSKITFVDAGLTLPDETYFGVEEGKSMRYEFGFNTSLYYKLGIVANVSFENILNLYSNYLEDPQNVDIDYQLNVVLKINRFLSTNISFQTIYDDNAFQGLQVRQVFGVGASYNF